jgi:hypothetical protein
MHLYKEDEGESLRRVTAATAGLTADAITIFEPALLCDIHFCDL